MARLGQVLKKTTNSIIDNTLGKFLEWLLFRDLFRTRPYYLKDRIALRIDDWKRKYLK